MITITQPLIAQGGKDSSTHHRAPARPFRNHGRRGGPQLVLVHMHQLFRIPYTLFQLELDTVNIYWWWCIKFCRVGGARAIITCTQYRFRPPLYHL